MAALNDVLLLSAVADHFHVRQWQVARLFERKLLPKPAKVGPYRVVRAEDLPAVEAALVKGGYLKPDTAVA